MVGEVISHQIVRIEDGKGESLDDLVVVEAPLKIFLNGQLVAELTCIPKDERFLVVGLLSSEGLIGGRDDIEAIGVSRKRGEVRVYLKPGQAVMEEKPRGIESEITLKAQDVINLVSEFEKRSKLFKSTGGVHSAALADDKKILVFYEDIGRHNALEKVFGKCLWESIPLRDKIVLTSGRMTSEIVARCARRDIPIIISPACPTSLGIEMAAKFGVTLVGFTRDERMNLYTSFQRIEL